MKAQQKQATDPFFRNLISSVLANLIGERDRTYEMVRRFDWEEIPDDMAFERDVYRVLLDLQAKGRAPTQNNVLTDLGVVADRHDDDTRRLLETLMTSRTPDGSVTDLSGFLHDALSKRTGTVVWRDALHEVEHGHGSWEERFDRALTMVAAAHEHADGSVKGDQNENFADFMRYLDRQRKQVLSGAPSGASLKFKEFVGQYQPDGIPIKEGRIPVLKGGEMTLITAREGTGKSTLAAVLAEHNAATKGLDVLLLHFETDRHTMEAREITRHCLVPLDYLMYSGFDPGDMTNPVSKAIADYGRRKADWPAKMYRLFCPGWDVYKVCNAIRLQRRLSESQGRGLLVIIDYLNKINSRTTGAQGRTEGFGQVAHEIKQCTQIENEFSYVHTVLFAQETNDSETGDTYVFAGGREVVQYAQVHISMKRDGVAKEDWCLKGAKASVDTLGQPRFYHKRGEKSAKIKLQILKSNDHGSGEVEIWAENRFYKLFDPDEAATPKDVRS